jgi:hypothetical protein
VTRLDIVREQIVFARDYTLRILEKTPADDWFRQPPGGVTHIAWQVGHLAFAEYRLVIERIRGMREEDERILPNEFLQLFGKGSVPDADASKYPSADAIRHVFDRVHESALKEIEYLPDEDLDNPILKEHALVKSKLQVLWYCAHHEMLHAGQIALTRRLLGMEPVW